MPAIQQQNGFTIIELLIAVVITGILAAVGAPIYLRYTISSKAAEAHQVLSSITTYYQSYYRSHGHGPYNSCNTEELDGEWIDEVVGPTHKYFEYYYYDIGFWKYFVVSGKVAPFKSGDRIFYFPDIGIKMYTGRLRDIYVN